MVYSAWLAPLGWGIFFVGLILAIILFSTNKKFYPVMYVVSIATYIFTVGFVIDAFDLGKNWILLLLALSSIIFVVIGMNFAKKFENRKSNFEKSIPSRKR